MVETATAQSSKPERGWQMGRKLFCVCGGGKIRKKQENARPVFEKKITPEHLPPLPPMKLFITCSESKLSSSSSDEEKQYSTKVPSHSKHKNVV